MELLELAVVGARRPRSLLPVEPPAPHISPLGVRSAIETMLDEPAVGLRIDFEGDKVVLSGHVSSSAERRTIEMAARCARGVCRVDNRLRVRSESAG
jgi:hypothetical protein